MENTKYGKRREGRLTPIRSKAQDTRANPNSWETRLVRKRWDIGLLRALSLRIMMMSLSVFLARETKRHGRRPGAEFGGDQTIFSRPNFRKNVHFEGKNF